MEMKEEIMKIEPRGKKIVAYCKQIEQQENVKILFAIESGSRLWRMESPDSDYDVRFVFVQPLKNYISLSNAKATDKVINVTFENGLIDISGFDIFKYCTLLMKSNPSIIEWFQSDIIYYGDKPQALQKLALTQFSPKALFYHYRSMCKQNYEKYLVSKKEVTYKKYLYAMRGLVNAKYVQKTGNLPPISFKEGITCSQGIIPVEITESLLHIIKLKQQAKEKEIIKNIIIYDTYIEQFLWEEGKDLPERNISEEKINKELQKIVLSE